MQSIEDIVSEAIHDMAISVINSGSDTLGVEIYDDDGNDLSENEEWLNQFLDRLYNYIHGAYPPERDWWAIETGKAQMLLRLANILEMEIDPYEKKLIDWLTNLF